MTLDPIPILAVALHSYSSLVLTPYGYDLNAYPDNVDEIVSIVTFTLVQNPADNTNNSILG